MNYINNYLASFLTPIPAPVKKQPKTVNVTFKADYLMGTDCKRKIYTRTVTAYNAKQVMDKLEEMMFTDIELISIK